MRLSLMSQPDLARRAHRATRPRPAAFSLACALVFVCVPVCFANLLFPHRVEAQNVTPNQPPTVSLKATRAEADKTSATFDGARAFAHVRRMVEIGPRPPGSKELARTRVYISNELKSYGLQVRADEFRASTPVGQRQMVNLTAELPGESTEVVIISSHYDTKLFKDFRFVGANDGGSSTGALLEIARVAAKAPKRPRLTYWFVFFDGEEAFCHSWDECGSPEAPDNTYGSRRYVERLRAGGELKRVRAMLLLDMIGYKRLALGRDPTSTPWLVELIWQTARELGYGSHFLQREEGVGGDDHEPFLRAGIEAVDLIQLNSYPYWHTADDTLDKISPQSLKIIGEVVLASLPRINARLVKAPAP